MLNVHGIFRCQNHSDNSNINILYNNKYIACVVDNSVLTVARRDMYACECTNLNVAMINA